MKVVLLLCLLWLAFTFFKNWTAKILVFNRNIYLCFNYFIYKGIHFHTHPMLVDIHTHNMSSTNVLAVRNITMLEAESFHLKQEKSLFSIGLHPWIADTYTDVLFEKLEFYANNKKCILIGECGLDKYIDIPYDTQLLVFKKQISISEIVQKPLIIHCVGFYNQLFELKNVLKPTQLWIIHGFRGKPELARQALKMGIALSFGERYNGESVRITPLEKLFIETDEGKQPIAEIYQRIAEIKDCTPKELNAGKNLLLHLGV